MKKTMLTLALVGLSAAATYAQGTIQFLNSALSKIKYVDAPGTAVADAPLGTVVGVFWGAANTTALTLVQPTATIKTTAEGGFGPGIFSGGAVYALPGSQEGQIVSLKIGAWLNKGGTTPNAATAGINSPGITHYGESAIVQTLAIGPTAGPGTVVWQGASGTNPNRAKPFEMQLVPEPSVVALGALGLGALLLRRRKA